MKILIFLTLISLAFTNLLSEDPFGDPIILTGFTVVYGVVTQNDLIASDDDVLAAFVNGELRGKTSLILHENQAWAPMYINTESSNELVSFFLWDSSEDKVIIVHTDEPIYTSLGEVIGVENPIPFYADRVLPPIFSPEPGEYDEGIYIEILPENPDDYIMYTLDGSFPDQDANLYTEPVFIDGNNIIKAVSYRDGWTESVVAEAEYIIQLGGILYGDIDRDGLILPLDAAIILQYYVGLDPIPDIDARPWGEESITIADVDGNQQIQPLDASYILMYFVGLIDNFPVEEQD